MHYRIVFSDVDGTLLTDDHRVLPDTLEAIRHLRDDGVPFVIISGRTPSGIYPIQARYGFRCPLICYSGALILDADGRVLYSTGLTRDKAAEVIAFIEDQRLPCAWNAYSMDTWMVKDRRDPRVAYEEAAIEARAVEARVEALSPDAVVGKLMCICDPGRIDAVERQVRAAFPGLSIAKSSDILLEIMREGVTKRTAVETLCGLWGIPTAEAVAFGDNYNDVEMLEAVGLPFLMGNAPDALKARFTNITEDNESGGISRGLRRAGLLPER